MVPPPWGGLFSTARSLASLGRLFLDLTAGFYRSCCYVRVETLGSFCQHSGQTLQMSRDGVDQMGAQGKHEAEARALSPPGLWEEKEKS